MACRIPRQLKPSKNNAGWAAHNPYSRIELPPEVVVMRLQLFHHDLHTTFLRLLEAIDVTIGKRFDREARLSTPIQFVHAQVATTMAFRTLS